MKRIVKDPDERYNEFLDVAQALFFSKGYDATSVQEIIRVMGVAKGTFYHYFDAKVDILTAVVNRMMGPVYTMLAQIVTDETLTATQKLEQFFSNTNQWKVENKAFVVATAQMLYQDENILLREKLRQESISIAVPLLAQIVQQGIDEGVFDVAHPLETAELLINMPRTFTEALTMMMLAGEHDAEAIEHLKRHVQVYHRSMMAMLGMTEGTLNLFNADDIEIWLAN